MLCRAVQCSARLASLSFERSTTQQQRLTSYPSALHPPPPARSPVVEHSAGICRVVPPPGWSAGLASEFALDKGALKFTARVQRVDQLQRKHTAVASQRFWNEYSSWMAANEVRRKGGRLNPVFNGREVELDRLHALVQRRGGYDAVTEDRGWREVANALDVRSKLGGWGAGGCSAVLGRCPTCPTN